MTVTQHAEKLPRMVHDLVAQLESDQQQIAALQAKVAADRAQVENLEVALRTARRIGAAVGILMANHKLAYDDAFMALSVASQHSQRKLRDIAEEVLLTGALPESASGSGTLPC